MAIPRAWVVDSRLLGRGIDDLYRGVHYGDQVRFLIPARVCEICGRDGCDCKENT